MKPLTKSQQRILALLGGEAFDSHQLRQILGNAQVVVERALRGLFYLGLLDRTEVPDREPRAPRYRWSLGTGVETPRPRSAEEQAQLEQQRRRRRKRVEAKAKAQVKHQPHPAGKVIKLTKEYRWGWGGQIDGYGQRSASSVLTENRVVR